MMRAAALSLHAAKESLAALGRLQQTVTVGGKTVTSIDSAVLARTPFCQTKPTSLLVATTMLSLVQELLVAKRDLRLSKEIKKLAKHDGLIIDEMGYVQQSREEMEVLFTLLAERYEAAASC